MNPPGHENAIIDNYVPIYRSCVRLQFNLNTKAVVSGRENTRLESRRIWISPRSCNEVLVQLISLSAELFRLTKYIKMRGVSQMFSQAAPSLERSDKYYSPIYSDDIRSQHSWPDLNVI